MRLADLEQYASADETFTPVHSVAGDVGLVLTLRDYNTKEYRGLAAKYYKQASEIFSEPAVYNAVLECVAMVKGWNIDDLECTPDNVLTLFKDERKHWIAFQVQDRVIGKKLSSSVRLGSSKSGASSPDGQPVQPKARD
jgi:hypothetical protein